MSHMGISNFNSWLLVHPWEAEVTALVNGSLPSTWVGNQVPGSQLQPGPVRPLVDI